MEPGGAVLLEKLGLGGRVIVVHGDDIVVAAGQAHGAAVQNIDGGQQVHGYSFDKTVSSAMVAAAPR